MKRSILIGVSIVTVLGILLAAENTIDEAQTKASFEILSQHIIFATGIIYTINLFKRRYN